MPCVQDEACVKVLDCGASDTVVQDRQIDVMLIAKNIITMQVCQTQVCQVLVWSRKPGYVVCMPTAPKYNVTFCNSPECKATSPFLAIPQIWLAFQNFSLKLCTLHLWSARSAYSVEP